jgi:hypothetical protein
MRSYGIPEQTRFLRWAVEFHSTGERTRLYCATEDVMRSYGIPEQTRLLKWAVEFHSTGEYFGWAGPLARPVVSGCHTKPDFLMVCNTRAAAISQ